jgi:CBS domain-containing protein
MTAPNALIAATIDHLGRFAPFDRMEHDHLTWLAGRLKLAYYGKNEVVLPADQGEVQTFYIIKQGAIEGAQNDKEAWLELHEGECFPIGALLARRPVVSTFRAQTDVFSYELPAADFHQLLRLSQPFHDFCTFRLADLLAQSQLQTQAHYASTVSAQQSLETPLAEITRRQPITCGPETPLGSALETMREAKIGSIVITDEAQRPLGMFTVHDLIGRVILPNANLDTPMRVMMSPDPVTLPSTAHAFEAALAMARHGFRHILAVEGDRLTGVVSEKDLFSLQRVGVTQVSTTIHAAANLTQLQKAADDIRQLGHNMLAQGVAAEQLSQILSTLNDLLTERVIELECAASNHCRHPFCWLAFGSEGRLEQTLATDQDNGIIFELAPGENAEEVRAELLRFADRINIALDACGFPLCKGDIMARNPKWCLSLEEWKSTFARWMDNGDPEALLNASIFFDFRSLSGKEALAEELRRWLLARIADSPAMLHQMAANALHNSPPLGLVRDFVVASGGEHARTLDLKVNGATPFVDAARIFALATGVAATGTAARLRAVAPRLNIPRAEVEGWMSAFYFIQLLRLRRQHDANKAGQAMDNRINPDQLNDLDRRILKESFRQARKVQARLAMSYQV